MHAVQAELGGRGGVPRGAPAGDPATDLDEALARVGRACPSPRGLVLPKIMDWNEEAGRFTYDEGYAKKRPDWTYE